MTAPSVPTTRLLVLAVGPARAFIAAAQCSQDLLAGSEILARLSRTGVNALEAFGAKLVFPAPDALGDPLATVGNKMLVEIDSGVDPQILVAAATGAIRTQWLRLARKGREAAESKGVRVNQALWERQVRGFVQIYAAWTPAQEETLAYRQVERLLSGRKAMRDFDAWIGPAEPEKSASSDGTSQSVILDAGSCASLRPGEALDSVGLTKRFFPAREGYPAVTRVAADPLVRALAATGEDGARLLADLHAALGNPQRPGWPEGYKLLVDDADALYGDENDTDEFRDPRARDVPARIRELSRRIRTEFHLRPSPYYAIVRADGDRIGAHIDDLVSAAAWRKAAQCLADFARQARGSVLRFQGVPVYAGEDDILAFAPVDTVLAMAHQLHLDFERTVGSPLAAMSGSRTRPTLSVGVVIGHRQDDMSKLLSLAARAEQWAKQPGTLGDPWRLGSADDRQGDGLCLTCRTGSGAELVTVRAPWRENPARRLTECVQWMQTGKLTPRTARDLEELARRYGSANREDAAELMASDLRRLVAEDDAASAALSADVEFRTARAHDVPRLAHLAHELLLASHLVTVMRPCGGRIAMCQEEAPS